MLTKLNLKIIRTQPVALAISGGSDSMAMLHMMHELGIKFKALTVNHNLRSEALEEAKNVALICKKLGVEHVILEWKHDGVTSNVHDRARNARYSLMIDWCNKHKINTLCTAHHMDDRVEHFLIRVSRGAGILGLIDHEEMPYGNITIARPMFGFSKQELLNYLHERDLEYFEDKSNSDIKYLRTNIRRWLDAMPHELDHKLFKKRIIGVKENLARAGKVVQRLFEENIKKVEFNEDMATMHNLPIDEEISIMILSHILPRVSGVSDPPRMESMKRLYDKLFENKASKTTLCGCIIEKKDNKIVVSKEISRKK